MVGRILRVSTTFRRTVEKLGVHEGSPAYRAVSSTMRALASASVPGVSDYQTSFAPGRAYVRRVLGQNLWVLCRFDDVHLFVLTARDQPPIPADEQP